MASPALLLALAVPLALAACSGSDTSTVSVEPPSSTGSGMGPCRDLLDALPDTVADEPRRPVDPEDAAAAAWGDPAILLTCGDAVDLPPAHSCQEIGGVDWYADESAIADQALDIDVVAVGTSPTVVIHLPASYRPPTAVLAELAPFLEGMVREGGGCV